MDLKTKQTVGLYKVGPGGGSISVRVFVFVWVWVWVWVRVRVRFRVRVRVMPSKRLAFTGLGQGRSVLMYFTRLGHGRSVLMYFAGEKHHNVLCTVLNLCIISSQNSSTDCT